MKSIVLFFVLTLFGSNSCWRIFHRGRGKYGNVGEPPVDLPNEFLPQPLYFDQKLDHFNPSNFYTWKQKYFVNDTHYRPGGPVFLMLGGEAAASPKWMVGGTWLDFAATYHALCIQIEHRFYGDSHPTKDISVKSLQYLSSEQALADAAWFITNYNEKLNVTPTPKWIVFGGSYSGSLASWLRLKYPHLVYGAVASSAPLLALVDFKDYFVIVENSLSHYYSPECVSAIGAATKQFADSLRTQKGKAFITSAFHLCDELDTGNAKDMSNLYETLAGNFAEVVQYEKDNRVHDKPTKENATIDAVCTLMTNKVMGSELVRLAAVNELILRVGGEACLDFKYNKMIQEMRSTKWENQTSGMKQWTYQTCTEFGFFQTSEFESVKEIFGDKFPVDFFVKECTDIFGSKFDWSLLRAGVKRTNSIYGALDDQASNVVYVQGSIDPWQALGVTHKLKPDTWAIYIEGYGHCADMYPSSGNDSESLVSARLQIKKIIGEWLAE